jgi:hypothetical protein
MDAQFNDVSVITAFVLVSEQDNKNGASLLKKAVRSPLLKKVKKKNTHGGPALQRG